jgi:hypothetical protein
MTTNHQDALTKALEALNQIATNGASNSLSARSLSQIASSAATAINAALSAIPADAEQMPKGYSVKHVEGHGWVIDPPSGGPWVAFEGTPAGDLMAALTAPQDAQERDWCLMPRKLTPAMEDVLEFGRKQPVHNTYLNLIAVAPQPSDKPEGKAEQAVRNEALEEAARICERSHSMEHAAHNIRALQSS